MTAASRGDESRTGLRGRPAPAAAVLADRLAAALVHHEPGWRLPRLTALARRYSVSSSEIDAAIDELAARHDFIRVIRNDANLGFAGGNNVGIRAASGEIVVLLNNDNTAMAATPGTSLKLAISQ